jgi:hypothetical protein
MHFIGDIHGDFTIYKKLIGELQSSIQLGDMGLGFSEYEDKRYPVTENHKFIRGNHDDPEVCNALPTCLGDYGVTDEGIFFICGGHSIDKEFRVPGVSWWEAEQLSYTTFREKVFPLYVKTKPKVVISHDAPFACYDHVVKFDSMKNISCVTSLAFDEMLRMIEPKIWIHAHFHKSHFYQIDGFGTEFHSLGINEVKELDV